LTQINPEALVLNIRNMISGRLKNRGLAPIEITRLIKDYTMLQEVYGILQQLKWNMHWKGLDGRGIF